MQHIDAQKVKDLISQNSCLLIDIRDQEAFHTSHIYKAIWFDLNDTPKEKLKALRLENSKNYPIIVYCYRGNSSQNFIEYFGLDEDPLIYNLEGGFEKFKMAFPALIQSI